jgi:cyclase
MLTKRIIPCLDVKDGRTVKGINFGNLRDAGDPVELAARYADEGADELVFLDISATLEGRKTLLEVVRQVAQKVNIPFTVGGGISSLSDLINELAANFGSQCIMVAIDARNDGGVSCVHTHGGTQSTMLKTVQWAQEVTQRGAGEILLTSMDKDGTKTGFDVALTQQVSQNVTVPVIASGGGGQNEHFLDIFANGYADAALAASIFHFKEIEINDLKKYLSMNNISIRL